jgi:hypothetical protein
VGKAPSYRCWWWLSHNSSPPFPTLSALPCRPAGRVPSLLLAGLGYCSRALLTKPLLTLVRLISTRRWFLNPPRRASLETPTMDSARCVESGTPSSSVAHPATIFHSTCSLHFSFTLCQERLGAPHFTLVLPRARIVAEPVATSLAFFEAGIPAAHPEVSRSIFKCEG